MTAFDFCVLAIVLGSVVVAVVRGFVTELLSLGSWVFAFWCAKQFSPGMSGFLPEALANQGLRLVASFIVLFFGTWLATALLRVLLTSALDSSGLGGINRMLGAVFGFARGMLLVTVLVLLAGLSDLPKQAVWRNALLSHPLESVALGLRPWLPALLAENIRYAG